MSTSGDMLIHGQQQWRDATLNARMNINSLLRAAGVTRRDPTTGSYTSASAESAFDPSNIMDPTTGKPRELTDQEKADLMSGTTYGSVGGFSEAYQAGSNTAGDTAAATASAGLGSGGLAAQRQELALASTKEGVGKVTASLGAGVGEQYGNLGTSYADYQDSITAAAIQKGTETVVDPTTEPAAPTAPTLPGVANSAGGVIPINERQSYNVKGVPKGTAIPAKPVLGQTFKGDGGVTWVYRNQPKGAGWYKKTPVAFDSNAVSMIT